MKLQGRCDDLRPTCRTHDIHRYHFFNSHCTCLPGSNGCPRMDCNRLDGVFRFQPTLSTSCYKACDKLHHTQH